VPLDALVLRDALGDKDAPIMSTSNLSWRAYSITKLGITIDVVDGPDSLTEGGNGDLYYVIQNHGPIQLGIRGGKVVSLTWWRDNFGRRAVAFGPETAVTVCGRPARRQEASVPEERATGSFRGSDGKIGHMDHRVPPTIQVAIAGTTAAGVPFVAFWVVKPTQRAAMRADEDHFLASIRC
jgi:hypothetical protein